MNKKFFEMLNRLNNTPSNLTDSKVNNKEKVNAIVTTLNGNKTQIV
jgi:hypothetical protein